VTLPSRSPKAGSWAWAPWLRAVLALLAVAAAAVCSPAAEKPAPDAYLASTINPLMRLNAHAVVRFERRTLTVASVRSAKFAVRRVVTVLDAEGRSFGRVSLPYDRFDRIEKIEATLYDAGGKELRALEDKDVQDYAATSEYSLYDDNRVRLATLVYGTYPYTVDYTYEYSYDGYISWPGWYPEEEDASVEYSSFELRVPKDLTFRSSTNASYTPAVAERNGQLTYVWEASLLPPFTSEPFGPDDIDQLKSVRLSPDKFEIDRHPGELTTWKSLGEWYGALQANRQVLPPAIRQEALSAAAGAASRRDTVRALYRYLQTKTRYVSVQLGIGGWQPFDAAFVAERGYGDCKALTNYMRSLLLSAGIPANPVLIKTGTPRRDLVEAFPCNMFDHVILCVPDAPDSIWLECTSQSIPFGHISAGNEHRLALMVTPEGGVVVRTPSSRPNDNLLVRRGRVELLATGYGNARLHSTFAGNQQDYAREGLVGVSPQSREHWVRDLIKIPSYEIVSADYSRLAASDGTVEFSVVLTLPRYATAAGSRLVFQPNLMEKRLYVPPALEKRTQPVRFRYPFVDVDTVEYVLPPGYAVEALPKPVEIQTPFARYSSSVVPAGASGLLYTRRLEISVDELPADQYEELRAFYQVVAQADKANAAIVRR
jgi:transglutaminase-like putative cysteine protease